MARLDPAREAVVGEIYKRFNHLQTTSEPYTEFALLRATPGHGKTRVVQELYERLRLSQVNPAFWPPFIAANSNSSFLSLRHRVFPKPDSDFKEHDPESQMKYLWWGVECQRTNASFDPLTMAIQNQLLFLSPALLMAEERSGRKIFNKVGELSDTASSTLEILKNAGELLGAAGSLAFIPVVGAPVALGTAAISLTRKIVNWRDKKREDIESRNIYLRANDITRDENLANALMALSLNLPIVLVVDNAQFADERLISFLELLGERPSRILILITTWPDSNEQSPFSLWWKHTKLRIHNFELEPLSQRTLEEIFDDELPEVDSGLRSGVISAVDGNPLMLRYVLTREGLRTDILANEVDVLNRLPRTLDEAFKSFWNELSPDVTHALSLASHLGREYVDIILISAVERFGPFGDFDPRAVRAGLAGGLQSGYVRPDDDWLYVFAERALFEIALKHGADDQGNLSVKETKSLRKTLEDFLQEEHPEISSLAIRTLQARYVAMAQKYQNLDVALACRIATELAWDAIQSGAAESDFANEVSAAAISFISDTTSQLELVNAMRAREKICSSRRDFAGASGIVDRRLSLQQSFYVSEDWNLRARRALYLAYQGLHEDARSAYLQLIDEIQKVEADDDHPNFWSSTRYVNELHATLFECAQTLIEIGSHALALELLDPIESAIGGEEISPWLDASTLLGLKITKAQAHAGLRQVDLALQLLEQARAIYEEWTADDTATLSSIDTTIVVALLYGERWSEAIAKTEEVLRSELAKDVPSLSYVRSTRINLSIALAHADRAYEALEIQEGLLADVMSSADHQAIEEFRLKSLIGETLFLLDRFPEALSFQQPARDYFLKRFGPGHLFSMDSEKSFHLTLQRLEQSM